MSTPEPTPALPKKRKGRRKRRAAAARKQPSELAGLTVQDCPTACGPNGCVISGTVICAHPRKGGLQGRSMQDQAAIERLNRAQKMLGKKTMDARFT